MVQKREAYYSPLAICFRLFLRAKNLSTMVGLEYTELFKSESSDRISMLLGSDSTYTNEIKSKTFLFFFFKPFHTKLHFICFNSLYTVNLQWYTLLNTLFGFAREDYPIVCSDSFDFLFIGKQCVSIFYSSLQTVYDTSKYNINWFRCLDLYQYYHITHSKVCLSYTKSFWKFLCLCWSLWTCTTSH